MHAVDLIEMRFFGHPKGVQAALFYLNYFCNLLYKAVYFTANFHLYLGRSAAPNFFNAVVGMLEDPMVTVHSIKNTYCRVHIP